QALRARREERAACAARVGIRKAGLGSPAGVAERRVRRRDVTESLVRENLPCTGAARRTTTSLQSRCNDESNRPSERGERSEPPARLAWGFERPGLQARPGSRSGASGA